MSNYAATVVRIENLRKHENADRLQCTNIFGNNVIVGLDTKVGDICLYFPMESQLGQEFAEGNDLIRRKDENGKPAGGMFDQNRRVRAQTLRGEKSMGFLAPMSYLTNVNPSVDLPKIGDEIETWGGYEISKKYVVPQKERGVQGPSQKGKKKTQKSKIVDNQFHFHFDTSHLGKNTHRIDSKSLISVTWKLHGTSFVTGNVLTTKKLKWYERLLKKIGVNVVDTHYDYVYASRKVIKGVESNFEETRNAGGFYGYDLWGEVGKQKFFNKLHRGETVYGEIVGFTPSGSAIQKGYDYGCKQGEYKVFIYRITQTNVDGIVTELPWHQVVHRAKEIGVETVPEIYYGNANMGGDVLMAQLQEGYVYDQDCQFCKNRVPAEGVVVRVEEGDGITNYKLKSFRFAQHESKMMDTGESDMESEESQADEK